MAESSTKIITLENLGEFKNQYNATVSSKKLDSVQLEANATATGAVELNTIQIKGKYYKITHRSKTSELTNDSGFITKAISNLDNYYTKQEVTGLINGVSSINFEIVTDLPTTGSSTTIYLKAHANGTNNAYDEYIYIKGKWELIGSTAVDLSNYYTVAQADAKFALSSDIPVVNNATITFTQNGTKRGTISLNQTNDATIELSDSAYTLPIASDSVLGGVKVGSNLTISNGVLSAVQGKVTVDAELSSTSVNSVQNKAINAALATKQASLSAAQLSATNSGITANKVTTYDGYAATIANKADANFATNAEVAALFTA